MHARTTEASVRIGTYLIVASLLALATFRAEAATITPTPPTEQDIIAAIIPVNAAGIYGASSTVISGKMIRTDLPLLGFADAQGTLHELASFGPLPQGTYTYQVFEVFQGHATFLSQQTIVVAPPVPALDDVCLLILGISLAVAGCFALDQCR